MTNVINVPSVLTGSLTQNVEFEVDMDLETAFLHRSMNVNVTDDKLPMSKWKIDVKINKVRGERGEMLVTSELLDVVNDSEVKVILKGVVLNSDRLEIGPPCSTGDVLKKHGKLNMVLANNVVRLGQQYSAQLELAIEYLHQNIPKKEAVMKKFMETSYQNFSQVMTDLLESSSFANAKIICMDGTEINVNKEILSSRSPVFKAMFGTDMKEAATGVVEVEDICGKSMKVLVEFMTTGKLDESWNEPDVVTHLAIAANKYGVEPLRGFLDDSLGEEQLVPCDLELLHLASRIGFQKAEEKIAVNVARRVKGAKTRDQFLASIGIWRKPLCKRRRRQAEKGLIKWMNEQLDGRTGETDGSTESSMDLMDFAADQGLGAAERRLVKDLVRKLELARSRDEVFKVVGKIKNLK